MAREIDLTGSEITVLKTLGLSGNAMPGKFLAQQAGEMEFAEFQDVLQGLITMGYVLSNKVTVRTRDDLERASFRVNPSYAHDLRAAIDPARRRAVERRRRRRS